MHRRCQAFVSSSAQPSAQNLGRRRAARRIRAVGHLRPTPRRRSSDIRLRWSGGPSSAVNRERIITSLQSTNERRSPMRQMAIWVDHQEARVFHVTDANFEETTIPSPAHHFHRHPKSDDTKIRNHPQDEPHFFDNEVRALADAEEILIMGPSVTKLQRIGSWSLTSATISAPSGPASGRRPDGTHVTGATRLRGRSSRRITLLSVKRAPPLSCRPPATRSRMRAWRPASEAAGRPAPLDTARSASRADFDGR